MRTIRTPYAFLLASLAVAVVWSAVVAGQGTGPVTLQFNAAANLGYSILFKNTLTNATWTTLTNVAAGVARPVQIIDPSATGTTRFYRLRTP